MSGGMKLVHKTAFDESGCEKCNALQNPGMRLGAAVCKNNTLERRHQKSFITVPSLLTDFVTSNFRQNSKSMPRSSSPVQLISCEYLTTVKRSVL